jgi:hypothetical protein
MFAFNNLRASAAAPAFSRSSFAAGVGCTSALQRFTIEVRHKVALVMSITNYEAD